MERARRTLPSSSGTVTRQLQNSIADVSLLFAGLRCTAESSATRLWTVEFLLDATADSVT